MPSDLQFFPRENDNFGRFQIIGINENATTLKTVLTKNSNAEIIETFTVELNAKSSFTLEQKVPAMLEEFNLLIYTKNDVLDDVLIKTVKYLVAGDVYIVSGQSNAESSGGFDNNNFDSIYSHHCNRAIGANFAWATGLTNKNIPQYTLEQDCSFGRPSSIFWSNGLYAFTGLWPLKLQYNMALESGVPHCFVNGAVGGTRIIDHMASHTPSHPDSLLLYYNSQLGTKPFPYDRIYQKLHKTNVIKGVKGLIWYQGEGDGNFSIDTARNYSVQFEKLHRSWNIDYPTIKKIIVLQINVGCSGYYLDMIRETQRNFSEKYSDVLVMSTVGTSEDERSSDNCHYTEKGYSKIADNLLNIARKHYLNQDLSDELILPANPKKIFYSDINQICIEFDKNIFIQENRHYELPDSGVAYLKDYFYNESGNSIPIKSLTQENKKLYLNLYPNVNLVNSITYLPLMYTKIPSRYTGPWILNEENPNIGAFSFYRFPVEYSLTSESIVFPNPASDFVKINLNGEILFSYKLFNQFGQLKLHSKSNVQQKILNVEQLSEGVYYLEITSEEGIKTNKLLIQRK